MIKIRKMHSLNNKLDIIDDKGKIYCELFKYKNVGSIEATIFIRMDSVHEILDNTQYAHLNSRLTGCVFFKNESEAIKCLKFINFSLFGELK